MCEFYLRRAFQRFIFIFISLNVSVTHPKTIGTSPSCRVQSFIHTQLQIIPYDMTAFSCTDFSFAEEKSFYFHVEVHKLYAVTFRWMQVHEWHANSFQKNAVDLQSMAPSTDRYGIRWRCIHHFKSQRKMISTRLTVNGGGISQSLLKFSDENVQWKCIQCQ